MSEKLDSKTLADVQPGGRVRLGDQAERARFEAWPQAREFEIQKDGSGEYLSEVTHGAWLAWKYLSAQPSRGGQGDAVVRAINSKDLYQVLMDVQNGIDSPALAGMANGAIRLIDKARAELAARQPVGPKFYTEDGPCWWHDGKAFIVTVDGDTLQLSVMAGVHCEFIGDARPFRVPAQAVDLGKYRHALLRASGWARRSDVTNHAEDAGLLRELLALIDSQA